MSGNENSRTKPPGLGEFLFNEIRSAFQDIRQRVVEEGWFGRVTTPAPVIEVGHGGPDGIGLGNRATIRDGLSEHRPSLEEMWAPTDRSHGQALHKSQGFDIER
ncbi:MAG: hypothetical protein WDM86_08795 [Rhizomicrobium sp.]